MRRTSLLLLCLAALGPGFATAQFGPFSAGAGGGGGAGGDTPWQDFKLNPKTRIKLDYRNAGIDSILQLFQKQSGVTIVKDPSLNDKFTLTSAKPVSLNDAFQILATTLSLKGYDLQKEGKLLVIRKKDTSARNIPSFDPSQLGGGTPETELKVYPIKLANASQIARVVNEVFAPSGGGGFGGFGGNRFGGGGGGFQGGGGNRFGGNAGGQNPFAAFGGRGNQGPNVKASYDDFSNSVIVNAPHDTQDEVERIIRQLDKQTDEPISSVVYKLTFASATDVQTVIQNVLNGNPAKGRGGASTQTQSNPFVQIRSAFGGPAAGSGQVAADERSNTLVVTATAENQAVVAKVIKELDTEVKVQSGTFVFQLSNAKADDVANLLNQAFGTRSGVNSTGVNRNTTQTNRNTTTQNRNNNTQNRNNLGGQNDVNDLVAQNTLPIALKDPTAQSGELETSVAVAQFGGGGFFGGGQNRNTRTGSGTQTVARDAQGRVVNVSDLTNQVTTISDPNTNSVIVVTTPENAAIIKQILDQLDTIPEQVMIETLIVEATLDRSSKLGFQWGYANSRFLGTNNSAAASTNFPDTSATAGDGFKFTTTGNNLSVIVNALQSDDRFSILSTPRIFTSNNVQAEINISQQVPYVVNQRADANGNILFTYDFQQVGIILTVTPRITSNGYVSMQVTQTANDLQGYTSFNAPIVNQREADTTVSVKDGETIILGGIIRNSVTSSVRKVPLLGDIPLLGQLFRSTTKDKAKTELLVFLTPRIVKDADDARLLRQQGVKQLSPEVQKDIQNALPPGTGAPQVVPPVKTNDPQKGGNR